MSRQLDWDDMMRVPVDRLNDYARVPVQNFNKPAEMMETLAQKIADLIRSRNAQDKPTHFIFPVGPKRHYPLLAEICNRERISWSNYSCFNMDEWLDWQCRSLPLSHPFSLEDYIRRNLFDLLDADLRPPDAQLLFSSPENLTTISDCIDEAGGISRQLVFTIT